MDIALPVYRQLLKRHNYPDYGTWKPQYAPENGLEPCEWNYMRSGNRNAARSQRQTVMVWIGVATLTRKGADVRLTNHNELEVAL